jgi:hypothetical protein
VFEKKTKMKAYQSTEKKLVNWFHESRENWKEKALLKQQKLRVAEIKIRDLEKSRELWKQRAKAFEKELKELKELKKTEIDSKKKGESLSKRAKRHHYDLRKIGISVKQIIISGNSLRGVQKNWEFWEEDISENKPSYSSIREWIGRIGLYELIREKEKREDWIFIMDLSVELGKEKCLVILGISQQDYEEKVLFYKRGLSLRDVQVIAIEIMSSTKGEIIAELLGRISEKVGKPKQIVSDKGSDLDKGIRLYQEQNSGVIQTYDVTHKMALLLKKELNRDDRYESFVTRSHQCRQEIQQTELSFLKPPSLRKKCRYFNLEKLVNWGEDILLYEQEENFELIESRAYELGSSVDEVAREENLENLQINLKVKQRFLEKLGWVKEYKESLMEWNQMLKITRGIESKMKKEGLKKDLSEECESILREQLDSPCLENLREEIKDYLLEQTSVIKPESHLLATSDIIESLFGKYKGFSKKCPIQELGRMILTIPLSTQNLTEDFVKQALETVTSIDVKNWEKKLFGQSTLSKRKMVFSHRRH